MATLSVTPDAQIVSPLKGFSQESNDSVLSISSVGVACSGLVELLVRSAGGAGRNFTPGTSRKRFLSYQSAILIPHTFVDPCPLLMSSPVPIQSRPPK